MKKTSEITCTYWLSDSGKANGFLSFIVHKLLEEIPLTKLSTFVKQVLPLQILPKTINKAKNKTILVEVAEKTYAVNFKNETFDIKIKTYLHECLNLSKGVVRNPGFSLWTMAEVKFLRNRVSLM